MSCGKAPTRRQVHGHKRIVIIQQRHGPPPKPPRKVPNPHSGGGSGGPIPLPRPKQKVPARKKSAKTSSGRRGGSSSSYAAWVKAHPFKNDYKAWVKAHPFNKASYQKWLKTHPFKSGGHTRKQALKHKVACHIKTRHAVSSTRNPPKRRAKPSGKRIVISRPLKNTAVKPRRAVKATRALKAR